MKMENQVTEKPKEHMKKRKPVVWIIACVTVIGLFFFLMATSNVQPDTYEIEKFTEAKQTIYSPVTVTNQKETDAKIQEAVQAVDEQYTISESITEQRIEYIQEVFDAAEIINQNEDTKGSKDGETVTKGNTSKRDKLRSFEDLLSEEIVKNNNTEALQTILNASNTERNAANEFLVNNLQEIFELGIRSTNVEQRKMDMNRRILYSDFSEEMQRALRSLSNFAITENAFFDTQKTT